jgi:hypothetical protein
VYLRVLFLQPGTKLTPGTEIPVSAQVELASARLFETPHTHVAVRHLTNVTRDEAFNGVSQHHHRLSFKHSAGYLALPCIALLTQTVGLTGKVASLRDFLKAHPITVTCPELSDPRTKDLPESCEPIKDRVQSQALLVWGIL